MKLRRVTLFMLAIVLTIASTGLIAFAEGPKAKHAADSNTLDLSDAQVFQIHALLQEQTTEIVSLRREIAAARESLSSAASKGDSVLTAITVLTVDTLEKTLKVKQEAHQQNLLSVLSESQKQVVKEYSTRFVTE